MKTPSAPDAPAPVLGPATPAEGVDLAPAPLTAPLDAGLPGAPAREPLAPDSAMTAAGPAPSMARRAVDAVGDFGIGAFEGVANLVGGLVDAPTTIAQGAVNAALPAPELPPLGDVPPPQGPTGMDAVKAAGMLAAPFFPPAALAMGTGGVIHGLDELRQAETPQDVGRSMVDVGGAALMAGHGASGLPGSARAQLAPRWDLEGVQVSDGPFGPAPAPPAPPEVTPEQLAAADAAHSARWNQWGSDIDAMNNAVSTMHQQVARRGAKAPEPVGVDAAIEVANDVLQTADAKRLKRLADIEPPPPEPAGPYKPQAEYDSYTEAVEGMGSDLDRALKRERGVQDRELFRKTSELSEELGRRAARDALDPALELVPELDRAVARQADVRERTQRIKDEPVLDKGADLVRELERRKLGEGRAIEEPELKYPGDEPVTPSGYETTAAEAQPAAPKTAPERGDIYVEPKVQAGRTAPEGGFRILEDVASDYTIEPSDIQGKVDSIGARIGKPNVESNIFHRSKITHKIAEATRAKNELRSRFFERMGFGPDQVSQFTELMSKSPEAWGLARKMVAGKEFTPAESAFYEANRGLVDQIMNPQSGFPRFLREVDAMDLAVEKGSLGESYFPSQAKTLGEQIMQEGRQKSAAPEDVRARARAGEKESANIRKSRVGEVVESNPGELISSYMEQVLTEITTNKLIREMQKTANELAQAGKTEQANNITDMIRRNVKGEIGTWDENWSKQAKAALTNESNVKVGLEFDTTGRIDPSVKGKVAVVSERYAGKDRSPEYRIQVDGKLHPGEFNARELLAMQHENTVLDTRPASKWIGWLNRGTANLALAFNTAPALRALADNAGRVLAENSLSDVGHGLNTFRKYLTGELAKTPEGRATIRRWEASEFTKPSLEQVTQYAGDRAKGGEMTVADAVTMPTQVPDWIARPVAYEAVYARLKRQNPGWTQGMLETESMVRASAMVDMSNAYTRSLAEGTIGGTFFSFLTNASVRKWQQFANLVGKRDLSGAATMIGVPMAVLYPAFKMAGGDAKDVAQAISDLPFLQVGWNNKLSIDEDTEIPLPSMAGTEIKWPAQFDVAKREAQAIGNLGARVAGGEDLTAKDITAPLGSGVSRITAAALGKPEALVLGGRERQPEFEDDKRTNKQRRHQQYLDRKRRKKEGR